MANPQIENGHLDIANELAEAFAKCLLSPYESMIIWCILRKTYGWHKKTDRIALSQICEVTGIAKSHVSRTIRNLVNRQIVTRLGNKQIGIQKNYDLWQIRKLPVQATIISNQIEKLPVEVTKGDLDIKVTSLGQKVTSLGNKKLPAEALQKQIIQLTKDNTVCRTFEGSISDSSWITEQKDRFSTVDVDLELVKMREWLLTSRKVYKNYRLFILNWLQKAQNHTGHQEGKKDFVFDRDYNPHVVPK